VLEAEGNAMTIKVLYIEDSNLNVRLVKKMLKVMGYDFVSACDGCSGIEAARQEKPDIILLDINLPDIDGYEVIRQLHEGGSTHNVPIVALTADTTNYRDCRNAGFDGYLNKPVSRGTLLRTVQQFLATV
jgi:CheY-like chemotaxis protein